MNEQGIKSSEFWLIVLYVLIVATSQFTHLSEATLGMIAGVISIYTGGRVFVKTSTIAADAKVQAANATPPATPPSKPGT